MARKPSFKKLHSIVCESLKAEAETIRFIPYPGLFQSIGGGYAHQTKGLQARLEVHLTHVIASGFDQEGFKSLIDERYPYFSLNGRKIKRFDIRVFWNKKLDYNSPSYVIELKYWAREPTQKNVDAANTDLRKISEYFEKRNNVSSMRIVGGAFVLISFAHSSFGLECNSENGWESVVDQLELPIGEQMRSCKVTTYFKYADNFQA